MSIPTQLEGLAAEVEQLAARLAALEKAMSDHLAAMVKRQAQVDQLRSDAETIRWAVRNGRQDILR